MIKLVTLFFFTVIISVPAVVAQTEDAAIEAEAQAVLARTNILQGQPYALAIENWKQKKLFKFTQLDKGDSLTIPLAKFYARAPAADASPKEIFDAARSLMKLGQNAEAEKYFARYLQIEDNDPFNHYWRGQNAMFAGDFRGCVEHVKNAFSRDRTTVWHDTYNFALGTCYAELGDSAAAKKAYVSLNKHLQTSVFYRLVQDDAFKCTGTADENYTTAAFSMTKGDSYAAFRDAFKATKCDPKHAPSLEILYKIAAAADERTDPLSEWANPLKLRLLGSQNKPIPPAFGLSEDEKAEFLKYFSGKYKQAIDDDKYDWAIIYANEIALGFPERSDGYSMRARAVYAQDKLTDLQIAAWLDASKALQINPRDEKALNVRGLIYLNHKKNAAAAIKEFDKGIAINPNDHRLFVNRGVAYYSLKDYRRAYSDLDRATSLDPNNFGAFRNKGLVAMEMKDYANAISAFESALELPEAATPIRRSLYKNLVLAYDATGNKIMGDSNHQELLKCCFADPITRSLQSRNPTLDAEWRQIENLKKYNAELEKENSQKRNDDEFIKLIKWDNENAKSTNDSIKQKVEYGKAIGQSPRITLSAVINSLNVAIEGREKRIAQLEKFLADGSISPANLAKARELVNNVKTLHQRYQFDRQRYQNDLRELR